MCRVLSQAKKIDKQLNSLRSVNQRYDLEMSVEKLFFKYKIKVLMIKTTYIKQSIERIQSCCKENY